MENRKSSGKLVLPRSRACFRASPSKSANKPVKAFFFHPIPVAAVVKTILPVKQKRHRERREGIGVARVDPLSSLRVAFKKTFDQPSISICFDGADVVASFYLRDCLDSRGALRGNEIPR